VEHPRRRHAGHDRAYVLPAQDVGEVGMLDGALDLLQMRRPDRRSADAKPAQRVLRRPIGAVEPGLAPVIQLTHARQQRVVIALDIVPAAELRFVRAPEQRILGKQGPDLQHEMIDVTDRGALGRNDQVPVMHLVDAGIISAHQRLQRLAHDAQMMWLLVIGPKQVKMQLAQRAVRAMPVEPRDKVEEKLLVGQCPRLFVPFVHPGRFPKWSAE
jgi:hypothetical protein